MKKKIANFIRTYKLYFMGFALLIICFLPYVLTRNAVFVSFLNTGQIGDTIGGIMTPFISFIAVLMAYLAYDQQYKANKSQDERLKQQTFEHNFFIFLNQLHDLEKETSLGTVGHSKQLFHFMFYEYKSTCVLFQKLSEEYKMNYSTEDIRREAFNFFLNGVSVTSTSRISSHFKRLTEKEEREQKFISIVNNCLLEVQRQRLERYFFIPYLDDYKILVKLYDGHRCRLVAFYRLFYKIVEYILKNTNEDNRKTYIDILLAQFSEHEIALLKIVNKYDKDENLYFKDVSLTKDINKFFEGEENEIDKYIYSEIMNCEREKFIDMSKIHTFDIHQFLKKKKKK